MEVVLYIVGGLATSLACAHEMPIAPSPVMYIKNVSRLSNASCRHSHPGGTVPQNLYPTLSFMVTFLQQTLSKARGYTLLSQPIFH